MKRLVVSGWWLVVGAAALAADAGVGKLDYLTPWAYEHADMTGLAEGIELMLARAEDEFAAAEKLAAARSGVARDMLLDRVTIGRRLVGYINTRHSRCPDEKDLELMAWQGAGGLRVLYSYFAAERRREAARLRATKPMIINVADYGASGDGVTECGEAFRKAISAAKAKNGAPVILQVPKGVYLVAPELHSCKGDCALATMPENVTFRSYRDYGEDGLPLGIESPRPWKQYGAGFHLTCHGLDNVTIKGEPGTEIRFADSTKGGIGFFGCTETFLKNVDISYRDNPSTQGTIESVDEDGFVFRRDSGCPDPDEPRFMKAHSRRFTVHGADGLVGMQGTGRMGEVERLSEDRFRFRPPAHLKKNSTWTSRKAGERLVVIARYSEDARGFPVFWMISSFSGAEGVRIFDSPGQAFKITESFALSLLNCEILVRHGSDDLLASNADGMIGSGPIGPYVRGCRFSHMEDDGFNIATPIGRIEEVSDDRMSYKPGMESATAFQVDSVTGRIKAFLRRGETGSRLAAPMAETTISQADVGAKVGMSEWLASNSWNGVKGERKADRTIKIPGTVGAVIRDTRLYDLRGMGVQVHCSNMLLDNVSVEHVTGPGMNVNPLFGWGMLFDVHNILVRNCKFRDTGVGLFVRPGSVQPGIELSQKMIQCIDLEDNVFETRPGNPAVRVANARDVRIDKLSFLLFMKHDPNDAATEVVDSNLADHIRMEVGDDGAERIHYVYEAKSEEKAVSEVVVTVVRDPVDVSKRCRLSAKIGKGWYLEGMRFPEGELPHVRGAVWPYDIQLIR